MSDHQVAVAEALERQRQFRADGFVSMSDVQAWEDAETLAIHCQEQADIIRQYEQWLDRLEPSWRSWVMFSEE